MGGGAKYLQIFNGFLYFIYIFALYLPLMLMSNVCGVFKNDVACLHAVEKIYGFMKRYCLAIVTYFLVCAVAMSQNRNTARKLFQEGKYEEAKPMFAKLLAGNPKNSEYNYWYAVCCYETGDTVEIKEMLEFAASRNIINAFRYLGDYHRDTCDYPHAIENYEEFVDMTKDDSLCSVYRKRLNDVKRLNRMIENCESVVIIDSTVVDKKRFLSAYKMGNEVGSLSTCADFFDDASLTGHLNETELGMDVYFSDIEEKSLLMKLYSNSKVGNEWGRAKMLRGFDTKGNDDYPFMLSDGVTLYFASDGEGSIGGYDLFVTRYDTENDRYLRPDNLGMPFNSTANDYMLAINEVANLGWFATDRNQPEGKVCVYVFIPNKENKKLDSEQFDYKARYAYATIASVSVTQTDETAVRKARQQLAMLHYAKDNVDKKGDFLFVVDDQRDYRTFSDFKSEKARTLFRELLSRKKVHAENLDLLELRRDEYATSNASKKNRLAAGIISLEEKVEKEHTELQKLEREVRRLEHEKIYK